MQGVIFFYSLSLPLNQNLTATQVWTPVISRCCLFSHKQLNFSHVHFSLYLFLFSDPSPFLSVPLCPSSFFNNISTSSISVFHFLLPLSWPLCLFFSFRSYPLVIPRIWRNPLQILPRARRRRDTTQLSLLMNPVTHIRMLLLSSVPIVCRWIFVS